ncbi:DUF2795 domain-containing protein [Nitrospirillum sp. BR 11828]|uniref:DUF2795 domain-containing protein n=1 Tax=Nitrospirillum sp. BR 11828 TaxID=3104325 RepID=UPI002ACA109E|nr:DUF2795 domain-containing protein [Nitrospirillum sp. BR 11828]MDZ5649819.1 DUF2795 domain-containing protein [Nitrospirillum sp. BR 11828]
MTRGLGGHSPANVAHYLKGIDFPADKQALIRKAKENGAEGDVLDMLEAMPDTDYETAADVMKGYGEADEGGAGGGRSGRSH